VPIYIYIYIYIYIKLLDGCLFHRVFKSSVLLQAGAHIITRKQKIMRGLILIETDVRVICRPGGD
jgi:hypothetical protein